MAVTREEVLKTAMTLSEPDRMLLATELMETLPDDPSLWSLDDPEFVAELERRASDGSPGIPWETVRAELLADQDT